MNTLNYKEFSNSDDLSSWLETIFQDVIHSYSLKNFSEIDETYQMKNCVDIGSNLGAFSALASDWFDNIYAFEPSYTTYLFSSYNFNMVNGIKNIRFFNFAVSDVSSKVVKLFRNISGNSGDSSIHNYSDGLEEECENTLTISLDKIYELTGIDNIDYLKIDCEGAEYDIMRNADLSKISLVCGELHGVKGQDFDELRNELLDRLCEDFVVVEKGIHNFIAVNKRHEKLCDSFLSDLIDKCKNDKEPTVLRVK